MFLLEQGKTQMKFNNGYTISIINRGGCYFGDNRDLSVVTRCLLLRNYGTGISDDVELAVLDPDGEFVTEQFTRVEEDNEEVSGWVTPDGLADIIYKVKNYKPNENEKTK